MGEGGSCHGGERFGSYGPLVSERREHAIAFGWKISIYKYRGQSIMPLGIIVLYCTCIPTAYKMFMTHTRSDI